MSDKKKSEKNDAKIETEKISYELFEDVDSCLTHILQKSKDTGTPTSFILGKVTDQESSKKIIASFLPSWSSNNYLKAERKLNKKHRKNS